MSYISLQFTSSWAPMIFPIRLGPETWKLPVPILCTSEAKYHVREERKSLCNNNHHDEITNVIYRPLGKDINTMGFTIYLYGLA